jgi:hypothetical protein
MIPTFLARPSTLLFNQLWLWRIYQCVPSFQPGLVLSLLPGITGPQERSVTTFSSQISRSSLPHGHPTQRTRLPTRAPNRIQNT